VLFQLGRDLLSGVENLLERSRVQPLWSAIRTKI